ncbi:FAD-binding protein [Candidatus Latescibacterota bacterium]
MGLTIIFEKCVGCALCIEACPFDALKIVDGKAVVNEACTLCGLCVESCEFEAIELPEREELKTVDIENHKGVWIFVQADGGVIHHVSLELIGEGRKLADQLSTELSCVVLGNAIDTVNSELSHYDINHIYAIEHEVLEHYRTMPYVEAAALLIRKYKPEIMLIGATTTGRDLAGGLATELKTGLTADCTGLDVETETRSLLQTRPAFGGNIMAVIKSSNHRPQMATVRPKVFPMPQKGNKRAVNVVIGENNLSEDYQKTKVLEWIPVKEGIDITEANIIISGGRGIGKPENFTLLHELAELLGGAVGASRAVVDADWIEYSHQIGQTGRTVRPNVYVACGISGAVQHLAGMKTSDVIIAINRDKDAPIFNVANYGFVGDVLDILPKVITELMKRLSK